MSLLMVSLLFMFFISDILFLEVIFNGCLCVNLWEGFIILVMSFLYVVILLFEFFSGMGLLMW